MPKAFEALDKKHQVLQPKRGQLSYEGQALLHNLIPQLHSLPVGETLRIEDTFPQTEKIRMHLYRWFLINGTGKRYKIQRLSPTVLLVTARVLIAATATLVTYTPITIRSALAESVLKSLFVSAHSLDEASDIARDALNNKQITEEEFLAILTEYERVTGEAQTPTLTDAPVDPFADLVPGGEAPRPTEPRKETL